MASLSSRMLNCCC